LIPYDGKEIGDFEGFGTAGAPDYRNGKEVIPYTNNINASWTSDKDGYMYMWGEGPVGTSIAFLINSTHFARLGNIASPNSVIQIAPIKKEDIASFQVGLGTTHVGGYFIPPRHDKGCISMSVYISY
jgi:hypothetical protein